MAGIIELGHGLSLIKLQKWEMIFGKRNQIQIDC